MKKIRPILSLVLIFITGILQAQLSDAQVEEAAALYEKGDYKAVIKALRPAATLDDINSKAEMLLADSYHKQGNFESAIEHYDRAEKGGDKSVDLYSHRGRAFISSQEFKKAVKDFDDAIALKADDADLYYYRAYALTELNSLQKAQADYNKTIELDPEYKEAYYNRAVINFELEELDNITADLEKAESLGLDLEVYGMEDEDIELQRARLEYEMESYEEAMALFMEILEKTDSKETKGEACYYIADIYDKMDDKEQACTYFAKGAKYEDQVCIDVFENYCEKDQLRSIFKPRKKMDSVSF